MLNRVLCILTPLVFALATTTGLTVPAQAEEAAALLQQADEHYALREDKAEAEKAIELYKEVLSLDPRRYEAGWRLSMAYWYRGNHTSGDERAPLYQNGIEAANRAIEIAPDRCEGHFWLGVNYGLYGEAKGKWKALGLIDDIKEEMNRALEINENCECGGPQRVLGRLYAKAPWFKGGSKSKAIEYFQKSMKLCPNDTQTRMFWADLYMEEGQKSLAEQQWRLVLKQAEDPDPAWIPETKENKIKAEKMLADLTKK